MSQFIAHHAIKIGVFGWPHVYLPLAVALDQALGALGFNLNTKRVTALRGGDDATGEVEVKDLARATSLTFPSDEADLATCNVFIVAVPNLIDSSMRPDLGPLNSTSRTVGRAIQPGGFVIYESTMYSGATKRIACR